MVVCTQTPAKGVVMVMHNMNTIPPFVSQWCDRFRYGQKVLFQGEVVTVFTAFPEDVPDGHVPVLYREDDRFLAVVPAVELEQI